jgi:hypothetical protein
MKVFWFFFSKKNILSYPEMGAGCRPSQVEALRPVGVNLVAGRILPVPAPVVQV